MRPTRTITKGVLTVNCWWILWRSLRFLEETVQKLSVIVLTVSVMQTCMSKAIKYTGLQGIYKPPHSWVIVWTTVQTINTDVATDIRSQDCQTCPFNLLHTNRAAIMSTSHHSVMEQASWRQIYLPFVMFVVYFGINPPTFRRHLLPVSTAPLSYTWRRVQQITPKVGTFLPGLTTPHPRRQ
jgi:hypothetical protein